LTVEREAHHCHLGSTFCRNPNSWCSYANPSEARVFKWTSARKHLLEPERRKERDSGRLRVDASIIKRENGVGEEGQNLQMKMS
jgi:hypothetical protein